ncbi:MAG: efflux RND transporter periplasmic adaptor subunit [Phycisphaerales bacterium]|nr:efflux RND transporter periplasmic adaptor subunit [Phycisphaerales bacterium]
MKAFLTLLTLAVISAAVFALGSYRRGAGDKPVLHIADEVALTVVVARPEKGEIIRLVQAPGDVEPVLEVDIRSEIVAKIEEMPIKEGDTVRKGDLLCRLDDKNLLAEIESAQARIAQLQSAIVQAKADLEKAERDLTRQVGLSEADATSDLELRDYKTTYDKARSMHEMRGHELAQADAGLKRIKEDLRRTVIRAPIDGVVSKLVAKQGEVVVTGTMNNPGTTIMTISDLSKMQVRTRVDEVDIPLVNPDQKARIYLQTDQNAPVPARVVRVASKGTKATGRDVVTFETLLEVLSDDARVKPGMTANVEIEVARRDDAITVPVEAVVHRMRKDLPDEVVAAFDRKQVNLDLSTRAKQAQYIKVVYVMDKDVAKVRVVESGIADTRRVELSEGVGLDDTVIIGPYRSLDQIKDGKKVALADTEKKDAKGTKSAEADDQRQAAKDAPPADKKDESTSDKDDKKGEQKDEQKSASDEGEKTAAARNTP